MLSIVKILSQVSYENHSHLDNCATYVIQVKVSILTSCTNEPYTGFWVTLF